MNTEQRSTLGTILSIIGGTSALVVVAMWAAGVNDRLSELQKVDHDGQLYPFVVRDLQQLRSDFDHALTNHEQYIGNLQNGVLAERGRLDVLIEAEKDLVMEVFRLKCRQQDEADRLNQRLLQLERPRFEFHGLPYIAPTNWWTFTNSPFSIPWHSPTNSGITNVIWESPTNILFTNTTFLRASQSSATNCWHEWSPGTSDREAARRLVDEHQSDPDHFPEIQQCQHCGKTRSRKVTAWR